MNDFSNDTVCLQTTILVDYIICNPKFTTISGSVIEPIIAFIFFSLEIQTSNKNE